MADTHLNPIIRGFAPDPSLVVVDGVYYLVNSSFHMFPGLPIYASTDLKTWTHIGNALNRPSQINLQRTFSKLWNRGGESGDDVHAYQGGLYAPTIRYRNGTFYIVCTNVEHDRSWKLTEDDFRNFIVWTTDIWSDEWSDPVYYDFKGIDTSLFWDDDGRVYLIGSASPAEEATASGDMDQIAATTIDQFEIDLRTGQKLSPVRTLWAGVTRIFPEGPHMYKKDGWYYLLIAEGGCFEGHETIMARSRDIWGPYEANPRNPVLPRADPQGYVQFTGHGDLFQDATTGQWYFVCLGARKLPTGHFLMGRETFLTRASWLRGEFPTIETVVLDPVVSGAAQQPPRELPPVRPSQLSVTPDVGLLHIRYPDACRYRYEGGGSNNNNNNNIIILIPSRAPLDQADEPVTFVGRRQRRLYGESSVLLHGLDDTTNAGALQTGLCYYRDEVRFTTVGVDVAAREIVLHVVNRAKKIERRVTQSAEPFLSAGTSGRLVLGVIYRETELAFWFSHGENGARCELAVVDSLEMSGYDFVGPVIGIFATGDVEVPVRFGNLVVQ
ncbi:hypothetical protein VTK73DRAFT_750 [Phialemonium thermophilum]|uniref:Beta-xylosidase C-terminal Concanavalin A-like domain-containing protein n=1 Tax=Phialemonium thermophilum TaxID=223376 RepID=A0ABR3VUD3_9PEZI